MVVVKAVVNVSGIGVEPVAEGISLDETKLLLDVAIVSTEVLSIVVTLLVETVLLTIEHVSMVHVVVVITVVHGVVTVL